MTSRGKVLLAAPVHEVLTTGLKEQGYECIAAADINQQMAYALLPGCVGVVTSTRLQLDKDLLDAAPGLQWIGRMGSGMEVIDVPYARSLGINCFGSPEGNCNAVGEHALGMLLSLIRRIRVSHNELVDGIWLRDENRGIELEGKTIAIIGFGHTGRAFASKLMGFGMTILAYDKYPLSDVPDYVTVADSLTAVYAQADIVSFHVPQQPDTFHYLNEAFVRAMKKPFIVVNTSRGQVVSLQVLHKNLQSGAIIGACLDVFEQEPIKKMNDEMKYIIDDMMRWDNVIVTPHIAGYTHEALFKMSKALLNKVLQQ